MIKPFKEMLSEFENDIVYIQTAKKMLSKDSFKKYLESIPKSREALIEYFEGLEYCVMAIASIYYYGNFKAETYGERMLEKTMRNLGFFCDTEEQLLKTFHKREEYEKNLLTDNKEK